MATITVQQGPTSLNKLGGAGWMDESTTTKSTIATAESSQSENSKTTIPTTTPSTTTNTTTTNNKPRSLSAPAARLNNNNINDGFDSDLDSLPENAAEATNTEVDAAASNNKLQFSTLTIREYGRILGIGVTVKGPPLTIEWTHQDEQEYDVDEYEKAVEGSRRLQAELKIPSKDREAMMKASGFSHKEILEATKQANITRNQRKVTVERLGMSSVHEAMEKISKRFQFGKKRDKKRLTKALDESLHGRQQQQRSKRHTLWSVWCAVLRYKSHRGPFCSRNA